MCLLIGFGYYKTIIKVVFNYFINYEWWICSFTDIGFNVFYVIMKEVRIIINFEGAMYQTFN